MSRLLMFVAGLCLTSVAGSDVRAREPAPVVVKEIVRTMKNDVGQAITVPSGHLQLVVSTYDIAPGARLPQHKHPFERYAYVIQGDLMVEQVGSPSRVYHAGQFVVESVNRWHFGRRSEKSQSNCWSLTNCRPAGRRQSCDPGRTDGRPQPRDGRSGE
jgi:quercetin dioxygenase-like cupin family protein